MIRNARIYKAALPQDHRVLQDELSDVTYKPLIPGQLKAQGFVPCSPMKELVVPFEGGYAFMLRTDERIIPPSAVTARLEEREAEFERAEGLKMPREVRREARDSIIFELAQTALYRTRYTPAYFLTDPGYLIVDTAGNKASQDLVSRLVQAMESLTTETIHVSDVARGLTTKLLTELEARGVSGADPVFSDLLGPPAFGPFEVRDAVKLKRPGAGDTVNYTGVDLYTQAEEITDQLRNGFRAIELRLRHENETEFKLCDDFALKGFVFPEVDLSPADAEAAEDDPMVHWLADVCLETDSVRQIIDALVDLLRYAEPESDETD